MSLDHYLIIQQIVMSLVLALGGQLLFVSILRILRGTCIHYSSRLMGVALMIVPIASFVYFFFGLYNLEPNIAIATNLTAYSLTSGFITASILIVIKGECYLPRLRWCITAGCLYPVILWSGLYFGSPAVDRHVIVALYTVFVVCLLTFATLCIYFYVKERKRLKECGCRRQIELKLLGRILNVAFCLLLVSVCSAPFFSYPLWLGGVFITSFIVGAIYLHVGYCKIIAQYIVSVSTGEQVPCVEDCVVCSNNDLGAQDDDTILEADVINTPVLSDENKLRIEKSLTKWLANKEYLNPNISINLVAQSVCTNRTYLSKYVNLIYGCSFRTWVTQLRIDEAKSLLLSNPDLTVVDISNRVGFSSAESFNHTFTSQENLSPVKWREQQLQ